MTTTYLERLLDPWREFDQMSRMLSNTAPNTAREYPAVNVWVSGDDAVVTTEVPGVDREAIDITVSGNTVTLSGSRPLEETGEGISFHRHELRHGNFSKTVKLPFNIDSEKVHASYKKGILEVALPKLATEKPKKITIQS